MDNMVQVFVSTLDLFLAVDKRLPDVEQVWVLDSPDVLLLPEAIATEQTPFPPDSWDDD